MRYFYDTEFIDDGRTIELISIGVVAEDGREYYAVSTEFDPERAGSWVRANVLPKLPPPASQLWRSRRQIRADLEKFFGVSADAPMATSRSSCGRGWRPTTTSRCVSCGARCPSPAAGDTPLHPGVAAVVGGPRIARGCRRGRATSTMRWSTPAISCADSG